MKLILLQPTVFGVKTVDVNKHFIRRIFDRKHCLLYRTSVKISRFVLLLFKFVYNHDFHKVFFFLKSNTFFRDLVRINSILSIFYKTGER